MLPVAESDPEKGEQAREDQDQRQGRQRQEQKSTARGAAAVCYGINRKWCCGLQRRLAIRMTLCRKRKPRLQNPAASTLTSAAHLPTRRRHRVSLPSAFEGGSATPKNHTAIIESPHITCQTPQTTRSSASNLLMSSRYPPVATI